MKPVIFSVVFITLTIFCYAQKFKPVLNLAKGSTYYLSASSNSAIAQTIGGQQHKIAITLNWKMSFKVTKITDSVYTMDAAYQSLSVKIEQAAGLIDFDSNRSDPNDRSSMVFAAIVNKPLEVDITKNGKVKSVSNPDKLIQDAIASVPQLDTTQKAQTKTLLIQYLNPETIKGNLENGVSIFPMTPVAKDDKWFVDIKRETPAKMTFNINYQLTDMVKDLYLVHGEGTISTDRDADSIQINGMPVKYNLNGSLTSDIRLNKTDGWASSIRTTQLMTGDMQIQDNKLLPGGMSMPVSFNTSVVITGN